MVCTVEHWRPEPYFPYFPDRLENYLINGRRLPNPWTDSLSPDSAYVYRLMRQCWAPAPSNRPSFTYLADALRQLLGQRTSSHIALKQDQERAQYAKLVFENREYLELSGRHHPEE